MSTTSPDHVGAFTATCDVCGNVYDRAFTINSGSRVGTFDSFECAIHAMAPECARCGCKVLGHGVEADGQIFCCAHCARMSGEDQIVDRV